MEQLKAARSLIAAETKGVLCTNSAKFPGYPFGSITPYVLDPEGRPLVLISGLAIHTKNLLADARCALLVATDGPDAQPLSGPRANLLGKLAVLPEAERESAVSAYVAKHPAAAQWIEFGDFRFFRLEIESIYYVGGFGVMGWIEAADYFT